MTGKASNWPPRRGEGPLSAEQARARAQATSLACAHCGKDQITQILEPDMGKVSDPVRLYLALDMYFVAYEELKRLGCTFKSVTVERAAKLMTGVDMEWKT